MTMQISKEDACDEQGPAVGKGLRLDTSKVSLDHNDMNTEINEEGFWISQNTIT